MLNTGTLPAQGNRYGYHGGYMMKVIALALVIVLLATTGCAHNAMVKVKAEDGRVYNVRSERAQPTGMDVPIVWGDFLLWNGLGIGIGVVTAIILSSHYQAQLRALGYRAVTP